MVTLRFKLLAETLGTALLLAVVIGSGIMARRLAGGNVGVALLANTLATVAGLYILVEIFAPISGAHFNPDVSALMALRGELPGRLLLPYVAAQLLGAVLGAWLAHAMFELAIVQFATQVRSGTGQWMAEVVATAGLLPVILRAPPGRVGVMVACWIGAAYWFTASTSLGQPCCRCSRSHVHQQLCRYRPAQRARLRRGAVDRRRAGPWFTRLPDPEVEFRICLDSGGRSNIAHHLRQPRRSGKPVDACDAS